MPLARGRARGVFISCCVLVLVFALWGINETLPLIPGACAFLNRSKGCWTLPVMVVGHGREARVCLWE